MQNHSLQILKFQVGHSLGSVCQEYHTSFAGLALLALASFILGYALATLWYYSYNFYEKELWDKGAVDDNGPYTFPKAAVVSPSSEKGQIDSSVVVEFLA